jgi:hypothetical protein
MQRGLLALALFTLGSPAMAGEGLRVVGTWHAWSIGTTTELVVVKNMTHAKPMTAADMPYMKPQLLRSLLSYKHKDFLPYGDQPAIELAADEACKVYEKLPPKTIEDTVKEFLGDFGSKPILANPDKNTPYIVGSILSSLVMRDSSSFIVVSAVVACKEKAGARYRLAQKRGFYAQIENNIGALTNEIGKWILRRITLATTDTAKNEIKARSLEVSIKAIHTSLEKMKEYNRWLQSPEGKELGGGLIWDAPVVPLAQAYARNMTGLLEKQLKSLESEYKNGQTSDPKAFHPLPRPPVFQQTDLDLFFQED